MTRNLTFLVWFCLSFALAGYATGDQVVYDNGAGGATGISNLQVSDVTADFNVADRFSVNQETTFDGIRFSGAFVIGNNPTPSDEFFLNIFLDGANEPTSNVGSFLLTNIQKSNSGTQVLGAFDVYEYEASLGNSFTLDTNTEYWLSLTNTSVGGTDSFAWGAANGGNAKSSDNSFIFWSSENLTMDFQLTQSIPEPGSGTLMLAAAAWLLIRRKRRAAKNGR